MSTLEALLSAGAGAGIVRSPMETLEQALACLETSADLGRTTGSRAVYAGLSSDRVAYAVLGGYDAAVRKLLAPREIRRASFCVTEEKDGVPTTHPRAIEARLERDASARARGRGQEEAWTVTGTKSFATLATHAERWIVIATLGQSDEGHNRLRAVVVERGTEGVEVRIRAPLPFAPEIPHAELVLRNVAVAEILEGDGYERYVKPFRTVEDAHVTLAIAAYAYGEARIHGWNRGALVEGMESLLAIADEADATTAATHLALDDALTATKHALLGLPWEAAPPPIGERWLRDRGILDVAAGARARRAAKARNP